MSISALPSAPARTDTPAVFVTKADAFVAALSTFQEEANALAVGMNAASFGGAMSLPYIFSSTTTDSDPGAGFLRLSSATQNAATVIRLDLTGSDTSTWTAVIDTFDDSTSVVKGQIRLVKAGDSSKWLMFNVSSLASPAGYRNITVVPVGSSATNPFVDGDELALYFTRTGDIGLTASNTAFTPQAIASVDIDCSLGNYFYKVVSGVTTFTFSNIPVNGFSMTVEVQLDSGSVAWPASVKLARNQTPVLSTGKTHMFILSTRNGGTRWRMTIADNFDN